MIYFLCYIIYILLVKLTTCVVGPFLRPSTGLLTSFFSIFKGKPSYLITYGTLLHIAECFCLHPDTPIFYQMSASVPPPSSNKLPRPAFVRPYPQICEAFFGTPLS
jgi:hypothetical protein